MLNFVYVSVERQAHAWRTQRLCKTAGKLYYNFAIGLMSFPSWC